MDYTVTDGGLDLEMSPENEDILKSKLREIMNEYPPMHFAQQFGNDEDENIVYLIWNAECPKTPMFKTCYGEKISDIIIDEPLSLKVEDIKFSKPYPQDVESIQIIALPFHPDVCKFIDEQSQVNRRYIVEWTELVSQMFGHTYFSMEYDAPNMCNILVATVWHKSDKKAVSIMKELDTHMQHTCKILDGLYDKLCIYCPQLGGRG